MTFVETVTVELKRTFTPSLKKEIVAFANCDGGTIYLGVEDDGTVVGVPDAQGVADAVNHMVHDDIVPDLSMFAEARVERFDDVDLVVVTVHRGPERPYCIAGKGLRPEGVFVRHGASAQPVPYDGIRAMLRQAAPGSFEASRSLEQDLSFSRAGVVLERHGIAFGEAQQRTLGVRGHDGLFTNLGLLLSDECPRGIKLARFSGTAKAVFQTRREFDGSVLGQVVDALEMLDMLNNVRVEVGARPERIEVRDYPAPALREALINAVVHRDYGVQADIGVNVFDDRCEIVSPGGLPHGATWEGALAGVSVARNAGLAALFYRLQWVEAYGTGLAKIVGAYEGTGLEPDIVFLDGAVKVVLPNVNAVFSGEAPAQEALEGDGVVRLSEDERAVLRLLDEGRPLARGAVSDATGFSLQKASRLLKRLVACGLAEAAGTTRNRVYRRSPNGVTNF